MDYNVSSFRNGIDDFSILTSKDDELGGDFIPSIVFHENRGDVRVLAKVIEFKQSFSTRYHARKAALNWVKSQLNS